MMYLIIYLSIGFILFITMLIFDFLTEPIKSSVLDIIVLSVLITSMYPIVLIGLIIDDRREKSKQVYRGSSDIAMYCGDCDF
jgi:hypothetical protein